MSPDSPFLLQLAILLLPGVIWAHLDARYATRGEPSQLALTARTIIFGLASYVVAFALFAVMGWPFEIVDLSKADKAVVITEHIVFQIAVATAVGFILSIFWMYGTRYKGLTRALQWIGATHTYGDEDVWDFTFNSSDPTSEYAHFRDFENKIVYAGWVSVFSATGRLRELVLRDVKVYDFDAVLLFESPRIYIARKAEGIHVEFPAKQSDIEVRSTRND